MNGYNGSRGDPGFPGERGAPGPGGPPVRCPELTLMGILKDNTLSWEQAQCVQETGLIPVCWEHDEQMSVPGEWGPRGGRGLERFGVSWTLEAGWIFFSVQRESFGIKEENDMT